MYTKTVLKSSVCTAVFQLPFCNPVRARPARQNFTGTITNSKVVQATQQSVQVSFKRFRFNRIWKWTSWRLSASSRRQALVF